MSQQVSLALGISEDDLLNCMQCGFCLSVCPTYKIIPKETATPRGRIALMKAVQDGGLVTKDITESLDLCLGCRACEVACPSGVQYGTMLEHAKEVITKKTKFSPPVKAVRWLFLKQLLPYPKRMRWIRGGIRVYQKSGLQKIARKSGILKLLPWNMGTFEAALPEVAPFRAKLPKRVEPKEKTNKPTVAFFSGCIQDTVFYETNVSTMKLLEAAGFPIVTPDNQTCCGAVHAHAGEVDLAKDLAKKNIEMLERSGASYLVNNQGGCGAMLKEYDKLLADDPVWAERAKAFVKKVKDINEILAEIDELPKLYPMNVRVTYQDSCHLTNVQKVTLQPRKLIQSIPGIEYVEMVGAGTCCGSAGTYNLVHHDESMQILDAKMVNVINTQAEIVVVANPGCLMQMRIGVQRAGLEGKVRVMHIADLLAEAARLK
ncbi:(Fe-S)-binding protein [Tepidibacillus sp. LV47]|uniref:(Fe-S)-binding protein n=1 Tax=Tepidibacillus sp. LV47 TaxID=3398228 RepID=UPI003AAF4549